MGGKHRRLIGGADVFADDTIDSFRDAARYLIELVSAPTLATLEAEQARLAQRIGDFGACADALDIWRLLGATEPENIPAMSYEAFVALADRLQELRHDAR
jgi:malonate decarboxylase beta subunit